MMQKAFELLQPDFPKTKYVYFSRKSLRQSLLWKCDGFRESLRYLTYENFISVGRLLDYYGFGEHERAAVAEQYELDLTKDLPWNTLSDNETAQHVYDLLREDIVRKSREQYDLLEGYLDAIGMEGKVAIVDIGWIGSMQYALEEFARMSGRDLTVSGFYVGMNPENPVEGLAEGYLYNKPRRRPRGRLPLQQRRPRPAQEPALLLRRPRKTVPESGRFHRWLCPRERHGRAHLRGL